MRSRKRESLNAEIEEGAASTMLVHLANISYRVGRTLHFDAKTMTVTGDARPTRCSPGITASRSWCPEKV